MDAFRVVVTYRDSERPVHISSGHSLKDATELAEWYRGKPHVLSVTVEEEG